MPRERLLVAVIAAIALLALAAGAASLEDPLVFDQGDGAADAPDPAPGNGSESRWNIDSPDQSFIDLPQQSIPSICVGPLYEFGPLAVVLLIVALAALIWVISSSLTAVALSIGVTPFLFVMYALLTIGCRDLEGQPLPGEGSSPGEGGDQAGQGLGEGATPGEVLDIATEPLVLLLGLALVGMLAAAIAMRGIGRDAPPERRDPSPSEEEAKELARIAGTTADRLAPGPAGDGELENEVYRAWREMTDALDVDSPETATPGEFAAAAIEAGLDPRDVNDLTALFETVRYGDRPATTDRERRAIETLRRIERQYGEGSR